MKQYIVKVTGAQPDDYYLAQEMADAIVDLFDAEGYADVVVEGETK